MNRDGRFVIKELQERTQTAQKNAEIIKTEAVIAARVSESEKIKKQAKKIFAEAVTEENLFAVADRGFSDYPILFIRSDRKPAKDKKNGYRGLSELAIFLVEELRANNFEPQIIFVHKEGQFSGPHHMFMSKGIDKVGYYLGIKW
jgi:hypothetical protein